MSQKMSGSFPHRHQKDVANMFLECFLQLANGLKLAYCVSVMGHSCCFLSFPARAFSCLCHDNLSVFFVLKVDRIQLHLASLLCKEVATPMLDLTLELLVLNFKIIQNHSKSSQFCTGQWYTNSYMPSKWRVDAGGRVCLAEKCWRTKAERCPHLRLFCRSSWHGSAWQPCKSVYLFVMACQKNKLLYISIERFPDRNQRRPSSSLSPTSLLHEHVHVGPVDTIWKRKNTQK